MRLRIHVHTHTHSHQRDCLADCAAVVNQQHVAATCFSELYIYRHTYFRHLHIHTYAHSCNCMGRVHLFRGTRMVVIAYAQAGA